MKCEEVLDLMQFFVISLDAKHQILGCNQYSRVKAGGDQDPIVGKSFVLVFPEFTAFIELVKAAVDEKKSKTLINYAVDGEHGRLYYDVWVHPDFSDDEQQAILFIEDITESIRDMSSLMIRQNLSSLESLAAGLAHEINNPLAGALMGLQNAKRWFNPDNKRNQELADEIGVDLTKVAEYMDARKIKKNLDGAHVVLVRAASTVQTMQKFGCKGADEHFFEDVNVIINYTTKMVSVKAGIDTPYDFNKVEVVKDLAAVLPVISCSFSEISATLTQILDNSINAFIENKTKHPKIWIRSFTENGFVTIEIEDNGGGLKEDVIEKACDPLYSTKADKIGLGLSLAQVMIVDNHQGQFHVSNNKEQNGALVIIRLPRHKGYQ